MKIRILETSDFTTLPKGLYYYEMSRDIFLKMFFPFPSIHFEIVPIEHSANICVSSVQLEDTSLLRNNEINIFISIENLTYWTWYNHYNKFGEYGNSNIQIYLYNHIDKMIIQPNYIAIPLIYFRISFYQSIETQFQNQTPFSEKKFMLVINRSELNPHINVIANYFSQIGNVDHISMYSQELGNSSCYHSIPLLTVLNKYKFILTFENSYQHGYITEKIFNVFLAQSIPIYKGSPDIEKYFHSQSFIHLTDSLEISSLLKKIKTLNEHQKEFENVVSKPKINPCYDNEQYQDKMWTFIQKIELEKNSK